MATKLLLLAGRFALFALIGLLWWEILRWGVIIWEIFYGD